MSVPVAAVLDRSVFTRTRALVKLVHVPTSRLSSLIPILSDYMIPNGKRIRDESDGLKEIWLGDKVKDLALQDITGRETVLVPPVEAVWHDVETGYSECTYDEVLTRVLPPDVTIPHAFEMVGHIAHLNLKPAQEPFRKVIGEVLLDKTPGIKTVVCKLGNIESVFRTFEMEVVCGEPNMLVKLTHADCKFEFDFSKVYWNSRLDTEHKRICAKMQPGQLVLDLFAGVGPFAVPAARHQKCTVVANDLNPESHKWLVHNIKLNKIEKLVTPYNLDARAMIEHMAPRAGEVAHIIMNLPATAVDFLPSVASVFRTNPACIVHCYTFAAAPDGQWEREGVRMVREKLGDDIFIKVHEAHDVRNVSPHKHMICVSFSFTAKRSADDADLTSQDTDAPKQQQQQQ